MKILTWNVRGINAPNRCHLVKDQLDQGEAESFGKRMSSWKFLSINAGGATRGLMTLWHLNKVIVEEVVVGNRWLVCKVESFSSNLCFLLVNMYNPHSCIEK